MDLLATAKTLAARVEAEATKAKVPVAVCIIDVHGNLVLQHRMNGTPLFSLEISERKAYTSGLVGMRTADLLALVQPGQSLYALSTVGGGRFCPMGGGAPLLDDEGKLFAGVGVSGGTAEQDVASKRPSTELAVVIGHRGDGRSALWISLVARPRSGQWARAVVTADYYQDYSPKAFQVQFGVFRDVVRATLPLS